MKILIIGGVAGGASTAARLRRLDENAEIIIFERGSDVSFANCGIPYFVSGVIQDKDKLLVMTPYKLKALLNIEARVNSEVVKINRDKKTVTVFDKVLNKKYEESYDKLVLSPGAEPFKPNIEGINDERIFTVRSLNDADKIKNIIKDKAVQKVSIIGAGYIGLEMAENLAHAGVNVSIIELSDQILAPIDYEIASYLHNHIREHGIELYLENGVQSFESGEKLTLKLNNSERIEVDFAILAIGVKPEIKLAKEAGLEIGSTGGIKVNTELETSDKDIYALGDAIEITDFVLQKPALIPLAGPANKQGRIVAENICGISAEYKTTQGTSILKLFDYQVGTTGSNEKTLKRNNIPYSKIYIHGTSHAEYYPEAFPLLIKLLFSPDNGKILGAQAVGLEGIDKRIDVIATALKFSKTVADLKELELSYAPPFGSAKDPVNIAGMVAENLITNKVKFIYTDEILDNPQNIFIVDVRSKLERTIGKIENSHSIPIEEIRDRLDEIPKDKKIVLYCSKGLKSYFASRILTQKGYNNVYSLSGGYMLYKQIFMDKHRIKSEVKTIIIKDDAAASIAIDACGMQCPGPIMKLSEAINNLDIGQTIEIKATDPGFRMDVEAWCDSTGNELVEIKSENKIIKACVQKGSEIKKCNVCNDGKDSNEQTMIVFSNDLDKAIAAFIIANGAAAAGKKVTMFFTFWGINILRKSKSPKVRKSLIDKMFGFMMPKGINKLTLSKMNMLGIGSAMMKAVMRNKNVPTLESLISMAIENDIRIIACNMAMDVMGIKKEELIDGVEIGGVATYINESSKSTSNLFI